MTTTRTAETKLARAAIGTETQYGDVAPAIHLSSTFSFKGYKDIRKYDYTRSGNPTRDALGSALAELEHGAGAVVTSTGMSALLTAFHLARHGDLILAPHDCYGGTYRQLKSYAEKGFFRVLFVDQGNPKLFEEALSQKPRIVLIETPSNPLLRITDIEYICDRAKRKGAIVIADNTFLSPVFQNPITLGADIVVHSTTKYINGHSDVVGGAVISATAALHQEIAWWANNLGVTGAPFDSFLTLRGLRTINLRVRQQARNAQVLAEFLQKDNRIGTVNYPGLRAHPGYELALRQQKGFGSMLSFELDGGEDEIKTVLENLSLFSLAESLGGTESLIAHPATMTHASMDEFARIHAGISSRLIRVSVGLESPDDLIGDVREALDKAF